MKRNLTLATVLFIAVVFLLNACKKEGEVTNWALHLH